MSKKALEELQKLQIKLNSLKESVKKKRENNDLYPSLKQRQDVLISFQGKLDREQNEDAKKELIKKISITKGIIEQTEKAINDSPEIKKLNKEIAALNEEIRVRMLSNPALSDLGKEITSINSNPTLKKHQESLEVLINKENPVEKTEFKNWQEELAGFKISDEAKNAVLSTRGVGGTIKTYKQKHARDEQNSPLNPNEKLKPKGQIVKNSEEIQPTLADQQKTLDLDRSELTKAQSKNNNIKKYFQKTIKNIEETQEISENRTKLIKFLEDKINSIDLRNAKLNQLQGTKLDNNDLSKNQKLLDETNELLTSFEKNVADNTKILAKLLAKTNKEEPRIGTQPEIAPEPIITPNSPNIGDKTGLLDIEQEERLNALERHAKELEKQLQKLENPIQRDIINGARTKLTELNQEEERTTRRLFDLEQLEVDNIDLTQEETAERQQLQQKLESIEAEKENLTFTLDRLDAIRDKEITLDTELRDSLIAQAGTIKLINELRAIDFSDRTEEQNLELELLEDRFREMEKKIGDIELEQQDLSRELLVENEMLSQTTFSQDKSIEERQRDLEEFERESKLESLQLEVSELSNEKEILLSKQKELNYLSNSLSIEEDEILDRINVLAQQKTLTKEEEKELEQLDQQYAECKKDIDKVKAKSITIENEIYDISKEQSNLKDQIEIRDNEKDLLVLEKNKQNVDKKLEILTIEEKGLLTEIDKLKSQEQLTEEQEEELDLLFRELTECKKEISTLRFRLEDIQDEVDEISQDQNWLKSRLEVERLEDDKDLLLDEQQKLNEGLESLISEQQNLVNQIFEINKKDRLDQKEQEMLVELGDKLTKCEANIDDVRANLVTFNSDISEIERNINKLEVIVSDTASSTLAQDKLFLETDLQKDSPTAKELSSKVSEISGAVVIPGGVPVQTETINFPETPSTSTVTNDIREKVINEQIKSVRNWLSSELSNTNINNYSHAEITTLLQENKDIAVKALNDSKLKNDLERAEISGYKAVYEKNQSKMSNIEWKHDKTDHNIKINPVIKDGVTLCDLVEKTSKENLKITNSSGREIEITSHRTIHFQNRLNEGATGPLDISMAAKDKNGKNMPASGAVYFTAHYDAAGKLAEISTPKPIKFHGEGDKAIGYIEHGGEIYTLPVTRGNYNKIMTKVQKNKGIGFDFSESLTNPIPSKDMIMGLCPESQEKFKNITSTLNKINIESSTKSIIPAPPPLPTKSMSRK